MSWIKAKYAEQERLYRTREMSPGYYLTKHRWTLEEWVERLGNKSSTHLGSMTIDPKSGKLIGGGREWWLIQRARDNPSYVPIIEHHRYKDFITGEERESSQVQFVEPNTPLQELIGKPPYA